jgi:uncharacterized membrane protein
MVVAAVALIGVFVATYLLLYKLGYIGSLICGADGGCQTVQASRYAYFLGVPVAAWGLVGYLVILTVAMLGTQPRFADERWISLGLLGLTTIAVAFSAYLSILEEFIIGAWCRWCIVSAVLSVLAFAAAVPELLRLTKRR